MGILLDRRRFIERATHGGDGEQHHGHPKPALYDHQRLHTAFTPRHVRAER
jgi:hypothetical protein